MLLRWMEASGHPSYIDHGMRPSCDGADQFSLLRIQSELVSFGHVGLSLATAVQGRIVALDYSLEGHAVVANTSSTVCWMWVSKSFSSCVHAHRIHCDITDVLNSPFSILPASTWAFFFPHLRTHAPLACLSGVLCSTSRRVAGAHLGFLWSCIHPCVVTRGRASMATWHGHVVE